MSSWFRRTTKGPDAGADWVGPALMNAATGFAAHDPAHARAVAFAVAQATRAGDDYALGALTEVIARLSDVCASDDATLMNVLSALQFASMLPEDARADWVPPPADVAHALELGLSSDALREQAAGLLWALVTRRLVADWIGPSAASVVASRIASADLREEFLSQVRAHEPPVSFVQGGDEFPCVPA
jgi:hypothetical protein